MYTVAACAKKYLNVGKDISNVGSLKMYEVPVILTGLTFWIDILASQETNFI
jgi:hypothetical protein